MSVRMRAGSLKHRVTLKRLETTTGEYGEPVENWEEVATVWAAIEPLRGREFFDAYRENVEVTTRIRIRYRDDVDRTMIVDYNGTTFEILHIIRPEFGKRELQLMCKERQ